MASNVFAGPVDYVVFVFDEHADLGPGLSALFDRVQQGIIEILDLEVIGRHADGAPQSRALTDLAGITGVDLSVFEGIESGILDEADLAAVASGLVDGQIALAVVYEDRSLAAAAALWAASGGTELFSGGVLLSDLADTLEEGAES